MTSPVKCMGSCITEATLVFSTAIHNILTTMYYSNSPNTGFTPNPMFLITLIETLLFKVVLHSVCWIVTSLCLCVNHWLIQAQEGITGEICGIKARRDEQNKRAQPRWGSVLLECSHRHGNKTESATRLSGFERRPWEGISCLFNEAQQWKTTQTQKPDRIHT